MYSLTFSIDGENEDSTTLIVSDVEFMYHCMSNQLLELGDECIEVPDELI
jgi:hypothetical protein